MWPRLHRSASSLFAAAILTSVCVTGARAEDEFGEKGPPAPLVALPLDQLGYRPIGNHMTVRAGYTNTTLNFIDADHLLFTYSTRKLLKRSPEQRENDDDHAVIAEVIHLPDGKVVRQAEWLLHDRSPYLWPLADGRFLFRVRNDLFSLDPLGKFNTEHLGQRLVLESEEDLENIEFSPERDLVIMETSPAMKIGDDPEEHRDRSVNALFLKIVEDADGSIRMLDRGHARSKDVFSFAFTSMGVLETVQEDRTHWGFDFHSYNGKKMELAGFTSTCRPRSVFISDAEFFAFGCRGGDDRRLMAGFNLLAEAKWVFTTDDAPLWVSVDAAPATGRFAVRNTLTTVPMPTGTQPDTEEIRMQEVRVYGGREGEELIRVPSSPVQRPSGNFALSPDGMRLAVLHDTQLEVYKLPPISAADHTLHQKEQTALTPLRSATDSNVAHAIAQSVGRSDE